MLRGRQADRHTERQRQTDRPRDRQIVNLSAGAFLALVDAVHFLFSDALPRSGPTGQNCPVPIPPNGYATVVILCLVKLLTHLMEKGLYISAGSFLRLLRPYSFSLVTHWPVQIRPDKNCPVPLPPNAPNGHC